MKLRRFPMRPVSGGRLELARGFKGRAEPKYNGWRAVVHTPTGRMWNREGEPLTITTEFATVLQVLRALKRLHGPAFPDWLDAEALARRHTVARGTLIILDDPSDLESSSMPPPGDLDEDRRAMLERFFQVAPLDPDDFKPESLYIPPSVCVEEGPKPDEAAVRLYAQLLGFNSTRHCPFYEGIVVKRHGRAYVQNLRPDRENADWVKHRWEF